LHLADTISIARALPHKHGKHTQQGTVNRADSGGGGGGGGGSGSQATGSATETLVAYASCQFDAGKKIFADLKQNEKGRFIKLSVAADGGRQHIFLPVDSWSHIVDMIQAHS
jgi:hypothetical protein